MQRIRHDEGRLASYEVVHNVLCDAEKEWDESGNFIEALSVCPSGHPYGWRRWEAKPGPRVFLLDALKAWNGSPARDVESMVYDFLSDHMEEA